MKLKTKILFDKRNKDIMVFYKVKNLENCIFNFNGQTLLIETAILDYIDNDFSDSYSQLNITIYTKPVYQIELESVGIKL